MASQNGGYRIGLTYLSGYEIPCPAPIHPMLHLRRAAQTQSHGPPTRYHGATDRPRYQPADARYANGQLRAVHSCLTGMSGAADVKNTATVNAPINGKGSTAKALLSELFTTLPDSAQIATI